MSTIPRPRGPWFVSRADFIAMIVVAAIAAIGTVAHLVLRLVEIVPNRDVPVRASVAEDAVIAINGSQDLPVRVEDVTVTVSDMPPATYVSVILAEVLPALAALVVIAGVLILCRNLMTGRTFAAGNIRTIGIISLTIAVGWACEFFFSGLASNGAIAAASDRELTAATFDLDFTALFIAMGVGVLGAAFATGNRLQRETEGLI